MRSKVLRRVAGPDGQLELLATASPALAAIPDEVVAAQPNFTAAINLGISASGLEDKEIYLPLQIDPGHWTRIRQGRAHFPVDRLEQLMMLSGNDIPLRWLALRRGYDLMPREDAKDRQLRELRCKVAEQEQELATLVKYGVIKQPA